MSEPERWDDLERQNREQLFENIEKRIIDAIELDPNALSAGVRPRTAKCPAGCGKIVTYEQYIAEACCEIDPSDNFRRFAREDYVAHLVRDQGMTEQEARDHLGRVILSI